MKVLPPKYSFHQEAWYFDPREWRIKLTDKATKEDLDSYIKYHLMGQCVMSYDELVERTKNDILDFIQNKHRYTIKKDNFGDQELFAVDGKKLDYLECLKKEDVD